jgi:predicted O-linked N-acetylglucosamine transferase (SPINDLY family)
MTKNAAAKAAARFNEGLALHKQGDVAQARAIYEEVVRMLPQHFLAWHLLGVIAFEAKETDRAIEATRRCLALKPDDGAAWNTLAAALLTRQDHRGALEAGDRAVSLRPELAEPHLNRGIALLGLRERRAAIECFDRGIAIKPDYAKLHAYRGLAFAGLTNYPAALDAFSRAAALGSDLDVLPGNHLFARLRLCDWRGIERTVEPILKSGMRAGHGLSPVTALSVTDSLDMQRAAAARYAQALGIPLDSPAPATAPFEGRRIRVGYFSMDFRSHAVAYLTAQLFELHDRNRFEVIAFSYGPAPAEGDAMAARLRHAFDRFIDVNAVDDGQAAALARSLGIDIAVDLAGFTGDTRPGIMALRAAPVQVNYIGFPGTMGVPFMDYMVADETLVPPALASKYAEKIAWLPCFQVNDRLRPISSREFTREELGLPAQGFVFCCLNRSNKLNPRIFGPWMRILARVPGSVLLLHADDEVVQRNLRREAQERGVDARRLVFAKALPQPDYLARYRVADLFLDTWPFNGGATVSDALWAGLPVITYPGEAYASRMGAALLVAAALPELVARDAQEYENLAVALAGDAARLAAIRSRLQASRMEVPLFDSAAFTRHIESAYEQMVERSRAGLPPDHIRSSGG